MVTLAPSRPSPEAARTMLQGAEDDLAALADQIHDDLLQALIVARYCADLAVRGGDPAPVREAVQDALVRLRRTVWHVRPRGHQGLAAALEELSAQRVLAGEAALQLDLDPDLTPDPVAAAVAYRLVQASGAPGVRLRVDRDRAFLTLQPEHRLDPGLWQQRARAAGAELEFTPQGVRMTLACPPAGIPPPPSGAARTSAHPGSRSCGRLPPPQGRPAPSAKDLP